MALRPFDRRVTTWLAIVGYALVASGLPLPVGFPRPAGESRGREQVAAKDRARPFPCMDKPCGCATAEQCFKNCCCHTPAQRLAWAKSRGVDPSVIEALERLTAPPTSPPASAMCCCAAKPGLSGATVEPEVCPADRSLAAATKHDLDPSGQVDPSSADDSTPIGSGPVRGVSLRAMLACGGVVAGWFTAGIAVPVGALDVNVARDRTMESIIPGDDIAVSRRASPDVPPPRA